MKLRKIFFLTLGLSAVFSFASCESEKEKEEIVTLNVTPTSIEAPGRSKESFKIMVETIGPWLAEPNKDFVTVSPTWSIGNTEMTITVDKNRTDVPRDAEVTISIDGAEPVTVKIRKGFNEESANAVEIAKILEDCGVAAIAVHGRTRAQFYSGKADWDIIRRVKEAVSIPVIGNGDVTDAASAEALVEQTGCDGIMIGRGAEGNPWIFKQILHYMETGETLARPTQHEVKEMMLRHARMQVEYKGGAIGIREMRKHVAWYTAGFPHSAKLRAAINQVESLQALEQMLNEWERG